MARHTIRVVTLIGAISAGGITYADNGFTTGHHTLVPKSTEQGTKVQTKRYVNHNGQFNDWPVSAENADIHHQNVQRNDMTMHSDVGTNWPLPMEAGADR